MKNNKTIGLTIRFFTNDLGEEKVGTKKDVTLCWPTGSVALEANKEKGFKSDIEMFHSDIEMVQAVHKLMKRAKIGIVKIK